LTPDDLDRYFPEHAASSVGVLNGAPSGNQVDADLDCPEAIRAAPLLLPATGRIFGRPSAPQSHRLYQTDVALDTAQEEYAARTGKGPLGLRGTGGMPVSPPSRPEGTGEQIAGHTCGEPAQVALAELRRAARRLAACCLIARHWPAEGSRDQAAMALHGALTRAGWEPGQVENFVAAVAVAAGDDEVRMR